MRVLDESRVLDVSRVLDLPENSSCVREKWRDRGDSRVLDDSRDGLRLSRKNSSRDGLRLSREKSLLCWPRVERPLGLSLGLFDLRVERPLVLLDISREVDLCLSRSLSQSRDEDLVVEDEDPCDAETGALR